MAGHRRAEATPSFRRLCPAMTKREAIRLSRQLALAPQPQALFGFELRHPEQMAEDLEPVAFGEFGQFGNGLRDEGHGLVGAALLTCLIR